MEIQLRRKSSLFHVCSFKNSEGMAFIPWLSGTLFFLKYIVIKEKQRDWSPVQNVDEIYYDIPTHILAQCDYR